MVKRTYLGLDKSMWRRWAAALACTVTLLVLPVADSFAPSGLGAPVGCLSRSGCAQGGPARLPLGLASGRRGRGGITAVSMAKTMPRNIKDTVNQLRDSLQQGLQSRCSRMTIEMPYAANFGVEGAKTQEEGAIPMQKAEDGIRSDRELARLIAGLFEGTELESSTVVAFSDKQLATKATKKWGASYRGQIIVVDAKQKKAARSSAGGFGAKAAAANPKLSAVPEGTEVLLVVAPGKKQLKAIENIAQEVGLGCLIVLVNARLSELTYDSDAQRAFFASEFQSIYHLQPNPVPSWNGGVLYRSYPDDWTLAVPRKIGPPRVLAQSKERWGMEEMEKILREAQDSEGDVLADVGNAIGGAFGFLQGK